MYSQVVVASQNFCAAHISDHLGLLQQVTIQWMLL